MHTDTPQSVLDMIDVQNAGKYSDLNWSWSHERSAKTPMEDSAARLTHRGKYFSLFGIIHLGSI